MVKGIITFHGKIGIGTYHESWRHAEQLNKAKKVKVRLGDKVLGWGVGLELGIEFGLAKGQD